MKHYESHKYNVVIEDIQKNLFCIIASIKTLKRSESKSMTFKVRKIHG